MGLALLGASGWSHRPELGEGAGSVPMVFSENQRAGWSPRFRSSTEFSRDIHHSKWWFWNAQQLVLV